MQPKQHDGLVMLIQKHTGFAEAGYTDGSNIRIPGRCIPDNLFYAGPYGSGIHLMLTNASGNRIVTIGTITKASRLVIYCYFAATGTDVKAAQIVMFHSFSLRRLFRLYISPRLKLHHSPDNTEKPPPVPSCNVPLPQ